MLSKEKGITRKELLLGVGTAGLALIGAGLGGCTPSNSTQGTAGLTDPTGAPSASGNTVQFDAVEYTPLGANKAVEWSFEKVPDPIPEDEIANSLMTDVLVVGCGFAGMIASISAAEKGANVIVVEKLSEPSGRGGHISAYGSKTVQKFSSEGYFPPTDYAEAVRRLIEWCNGRVKESLVWQFAKKSGACMDWLCDLVEPSGLHVNMWNGYYKGPNYTELPVTHFFYDDTTDFIYLDGMSTGLGNAVLVPAIKKNADDLGVEFQFDTPCVRLLRDGNGPVTGAIVGEEGNYTQINAKSIIIATGDYADDKEMLMRYCPFAIYADSRLYMPALSATGDLHKQAMWIGAAMQQFEPHATVIHLESGAQSYNFLHVNALGQRFMNEDVNTQSKSTVKELQPKGLSFTIYDENGLMNIKNACEAGLAGGISCDQQYRRMGADFDLELEYKLRQAKIDQGLLFKADTLEELASKIGVPIDNFLATVKRYNELVASGQDIDFGKRPEIMWPIDTPPYYAGQLISTLLIAYGGLRQDPDCRVLDEDNEPISGLFVAGTAAGEYYANDYPTISPGVSHGRCLTFGRIAGINAAGGSSDEIPSLEIPISDMKKV